MSAHVTEEQAGQCLERVREQFASFLGHDEASQPVVYPPGHEGDFYVISWDGGPDSWAYDAFRTRLDLKVCERRQREMIEQGIEPAEALIRAEADATVATVACPPGVWVEPVNTCILALHRLPTERPVCPEHGSRCGRSGKREL